MQTPSAEASERLRVLIVDDDRDTMDSFVMLMNFWGHAAFTAHDGAEALAIARKQRLDAALIDLAMPGQDGLTLAKAFRGKIPLLCAVTGYADDRRARECQEAGFDAVFVKPVKPERLQRVLADAAESKRYAAELGKRSRL